MANRFTDSFQPGQTYMGQNQDMLSQFTEFKSNPVQFLANHGINIPKEYQNSPEQMARYLLSNVPANQQNSIFQRANMLKNLFKM